MNMTEAAFEAVFEEYADALFRHAYFRLSSREKAKDMTQDTFIKAWSSVQKTGEVISSWKSFLFRIMNNLIIDSYRKKKIDSLDEMEEGRVEEGGLVPDELAIGGLLEEVKRADVFYDTELLTGALEQLPDAERALIVRRFLDEESIESLSRELSITTDALYVRIHRALKKLQTVLLKKGYEA
jgi:RNA polymerase sigma-70 factor (ECF subfamily)